VEIQFLELLNQFRPTATKMSKDQFDVIYNKINLTGSVHVLKIDNIIIGSGTLFIEQKFIFNGSKCGHIEDIIVDNMYRNKGYGKMLVEHLIKCAIVQKCYKIVLSCSDDVQEFYTKCGFEKRGNNMSMLLDKMI